MSVRTESATTAPGRSRLDRGTVIETALHLADAEGLDHLTIRRLAKELSVTPMALYWHVADKQALLDALADQVWADALALAGPVGPGDPWAEFRRIVAGLVAAMRRHPMVAPLLPPRFAESEASLELAERALELLDRVGFPLHAAADLSKWVLGSAMTLVTNQPGIAIPDEATRVVAARAKRAALLALPPERFPRLLAAADDFSDFACGEGRDDYFTMGVDLVVGAVRAAAPSPS